MRGEEPQGEGRALTSSLISPLPKVLPLAHVCFANCAVSLCETCAPSFLILTSLAALRILLTKSLVGLFLEKMLKVKGAQSGKRHKGSGGTGAAGLPAGIILNFIEIMKKSGRQPLLRHRVYLTFCR